MTLKIKYCVAAGNIKVNKKTGNISFDEILDTISTVRVPMTIDRLCIAIGIEDLVGKNKIRVQLKNPKGEVLKDTFTDIVSRGTSKTSYKIITVERMGIDQLGTYTLSIFTESGKYPVETYTLFNIKYPEAREISEAERAEIMSKNGVVKNVIISCNLPGTKIKKNLQLNLDDSIPLGKDCEKFPDNNILEHNGKKIDLTGYRNQASWVFGKKIKKVKS